MSWKCPNWDNEKYQPEPEEAENKHKAAIEELAKRLYLGRMAAGLEPDFGDCMEEAEFSYYVDIADMLAEGKEDGMS